VRDLPASLDLLALGRELLLDELLPLLPPERHRDVRLIATAMAIVAREAKAGEGPAQDILKQLAELYGEAAPHPGPLPASGERERAYTTPLPARGGREGPIAKRWEGEGPPPNLLNRLAADLRNGAFETSPSRAAAARAILWRLTITKLREGNPHFLAANGFNPAGEESA
jgi:hypothetical protein